jgi:hypothetical protein
VSYQILRWRDMPSAIKAWDGFGEVKVDLPGAFAERIDAEAQRLGLVSADDYAAQFQWDDEKERPGSPEDVVAAIITEFQAAANGSGN